MIEIKNQFSDEVMLSLPVDTLEGANLAGAILAVANLDGSELRHVLDDPILDKFDASPAGEWVAVDVPRRSGTNVAGTTAISIRTGESRVIAHEYCPSVWSSDGRVFFASLGGKTLAIPVPPGKPLPDLPPNGLTVGQTRGIAGMRVIDHDQVAPGPDGSTYAYVKVDEQRNLFRIPLH